jgi:hypothetical protein
MIKKIQSALGLLPRFFRYGLNAQGLALIPVCIFICGGYTRILDEVLRMDGGTGGQGAKG